MMTEEQVEEHMELWAQMSWPNAESSKETLRDVEYILHGMSLLAIRLDETLLSKEYSFLSDLLGERRYIMTFEKGYLV